MWEVREKEIWEPEGKEELVCWGEMMGSVWDAVVAARGASLIDVAASEWA
jgi:hypothetical protein